MWSGNDMLKTGLTAERFFASRMVLTNFFLENGKSHFERWLDGQTKTVRVAASLIATIHERLVSHIHWSDDLVFADPPVNIPPLREFLVTNRKHPFDKDAQLLAQTMHDVALAM